MTTYRNNARLLWITKAAQLYLFTGSHSQISIADTERVLATD